MSIRFLTHAKIDPDPVVAKDAANRGWVEQFVLSQVSAGSAYGAEPASPKTGQLWITAAGELSVWTGSAWQQLLPPTWGA